ncbi:hypothetical protein C7S16_1458 [Burkholderia thailandensis]|uniref:Uncharacterized protein n=1 Tax=Burkholderia thailandensis TaxID=57975 RepID=A0AAW9D2A9_BURTH|nr:hypothetical protein [Burkholderia thailandensis]MDW9255573.1 hypothetical protein [Burkholderia thailandensis]
MPRPPFARRSAFPLIQHKIAAPHARSQRVRRAGASSPAPLSDARFHPRIEFV